MNATVMKLEHKLSACDQANHRVFEQSQDKYLMMNSGFKWCNPLPSLHSIMQENIWKCYIVGMSGSDIIEYYLWQVSHTQGESMRIFRTLEQKKRQDSLLVTVVSR